MVCAGQSECVEFSPTWYPSWAFRIDAFLCGTAVDDLAVPRRNVSTIREFPDYMPPVPPVPGAVATGSTGLGMDSRLR